MSCYGSPLYSTSSCFPLVSDALGLAQSHSPHNLSVQSDLKSPSATLHTTPPLPMQSMSDEKYPPLTHQSRIIVVGGGGTIGSSTALHLARRGYVNVVVLDEFEIPSAQSAGFDLNKIAGGAVKEGWRGQLSGEIMKGWREDPVFSPYYHETGRVTGAHRFPEKIAKLRAAYDSAKADGYGKNYEWLDSGEAIVSKIPQLAKGNLKDWKGLWVPDSGWVAAKDTISSVGRELSRLGVQMIFGPSGKFKRPVLSASGKVCVGVETADGTIHKADRVIMACGAWTPSLIDLKGQCISKCWVLAHIQLTSEEVKSFKNIPVLYDDQLGFFIEPDEETGLLKLCNEFSGYTRILHSQTPFGTSHPQDISVPRSHAVHPTDTIPTEGLDDIKYLISTLLPDFQDRPLVGAKMCWCTDTADAEWLFTEDPRWRGLFLTTGDSGHSFHTIPYVGSEVADLLEGKMSAEKQKAWGWRKPTDPNGTGRGGPPPKDLTDVLGWTNGDDEEEV
ncbi:FAD-dependent oxidoreductase [Phaffia rhodozyma]|uniref:FAD-dependent oxidoreductase n=1 Tax=Phaffia rhodozyma TaxID=264483 RepID=A0A0F7SJN5_PHARH|nr:FAD-dependent oxidoreductase [Phaffia rhodozyma]